MRLYFEDEAIQLWNGDARKLDIVADESADLVFICPPWWDSGDYDHPDQIGFGQTYEAYLEALNQLWREGYRCLKPGRTLVAWVSDLLWRDKPVPLVADVHNLLRHNRFLYEMTYYWYEPRVATGLSNAPCTPMQIRPNVHAEVLLVYRKPGEAVLPPPEIVEASRIDPKEYQESRQAIWTPGGALDHPYARVIRLWSYTDDLILNPCAGQGTIPLLARHMGRRCVAIELNATYCDHIAELLKVPVLPTELR